MAKSPTYSAAEIAALESAAHTLSDKAGTARTIARAASLVVPCGAYQTEAYMLHGVPHDAAQTIVDATRLESRRERESECAHIGAAAHDAPRYRAYLTHDDRAIVPDRRTYVRVTWAGFEGFTRVSDDGAGTLTRGAWRGVPSTPGGKAHTDRAPAHSATGCDRGRVRRDATDECAINAERRRERIAVNAPTCKRASGRRVKGGGFVMK